MITHSKYTIVVFWFAYFILATLCCNNYKRSLEVKIPSNSYQIENCSKSKLIVCIEFKLKVLDFSTNVFKYYNEELIKKGWLPFIEDYYKTDDRKWVAYSKNESWLKAFWVDKNKTRRIGLLIKNIKLDAFSSLNKSIFVEQVISYEEWPYYELPYIPNK